MDGVAALVIGAGVVGIAIGRSLAEAGLETLVVDRARQFGSETSSRNSEVIHAGIHYPPGSLKARLCVAGRDRLYRYCAERGVPHRRCGKLIVAAAGQDSALAAIEAAARANGVVDLRRLDAREARALEPEVACDAALFSPSTGIVDSHALMLALMGDAEAMGCGFVPGAGIDRVERAGAGGFDVFVAGEAAPALRTPILVNAAGLWATQVAARIAGLAPEHVPATRFAKGNYFALAGAAPFSHLVYPVPEPGGLGIHATIDLGGHVRFGPDVEWCDTLDYAVDAGRAERFYRSIRGYWPGLPDGALVPAYSGIRPKLGGKGAPAADFRIDGPEAHGIAGLVNLFGIESPGLTASMAIADHVRALLGRGPETA